MSQALYLLVTAGLVCNWMFDIADWTTEADSAAVYAALWPAWIALFIWEAVRRARLEPDATEEEGADRSEKK